MTVSRTDGCGDAVGVPDGTMLGSLLLVGFVLGKVDGIVLVDGV